MTKGPVKRKPRIIFVEQATIWASRHSMVCQTINLSETGMLLIPPFSSEPGLALRVDIPLPGLQRPLALPAVLVREGEHEGEYAWGVKFELVSADAQSYLRQYLQQQLARQYPELALEDDLPPDEPTQQSAPPQIMIAPAEPLIQPARPKHKPIDRSAARRVPVKRRATGSQPAVTNGAPAEPSTPPDVAPVSPPPPRVPAYNGPLTGEAPPVAAPRIVPGAPPSIKKVPAYEGPLTGEPPPPPSAFPPITGSHPAVSPAPAVAAPAVAAPPVAAPPVAAPPVAASPVAAAPVAAPPVAATPPTADEPELSVTLPSDELLVDRPPVQEEGTPDFDDVPEWTDKSEVPAPSQKDRDLLAEVEKVDNKLDDIYKDAIKQLDISDSWADRGFSKKKKKKKKKGWF